MKDSRKPWQRMALSVLGTAVVAGMWRWATFHLYTLPVTSIAAFTSITNNCFYVIGAIVVFMVTGKLVYDWKNTTASNVVVNTIEKQLRPKDLDDGTI